MHVFQMSTQVATLCKGFLTLGASKWAQTGMFTEVVSKIATFLKSAGTARVLALEKQLDPLGVGVLHLNRLVPFFWYAFKVLRNEVLL